MSSIKLTSKQMEKILEEYDIDEFEYEHVYQSEWTDEGKYASSDVIFKKDGKYYMFNATRYGNHYRGYDLEFYDNEAIEVEKVKVVKEIWLPKITNGEMKNNG